MNNLDQICVFDAALVRVAWTYSGRGVLFAGRHRRKDAKLKPNALWNTQNEGDPNGAAEVAASD